jgi:hypothetical protein
LHMTALIISSQKGNLSSAPRADPFPVCQRTICRCQENCQASAYGSLTCGDAGLLATFDHGHKLQDSTLPRSRWVFPAFSRVSWPAHRLHPADRRFEYRKSAQWEYVHNRHTFGIQRRKRGPKHRAGPVPSELTLYVIMSQYSGKLEGYTHFPHASRNLKANKTSTPTYSDLTGATNAAMLVVLSLCPVLIVKHRLLLARFSRRVVRNLPLPPWAGNCVARARNPSRGEWATLEHDFPRQFYESKLSVASLLCLRCSCCRSTT